MKLNNQVDLGIENGNIGKKIGAKNLCYPLISPSIIKQQM